ncbi:hypothetical protein L1049_025855 [Liquidambar formosana]|uniref:rRNA N-glycosylase n=1 Tax=Liquidambar formosana TaxID=63359 RepID=A0AAP0NCK3_LIQFO
MDTYVSLEKAYGGDKARVQLGKMQLNDSIFHLWNKDPSSAKKAKAFLTFILMFPEAIRFESILVYLSGKVEVGATLPDNFGDIVNEWKTFSKALFWIHMGYSLELGDRLCKMLKVDTKTKEEAKKAFVDVRQIVPVFT